MSESKQKQQKQFQQSFKYTDEEIGLIKSYFSDNRELVIAIRKALLQAELNEQEMNLIKGLNENILRIIRKELLPEIDLNSMAFLSDAWSGIDFSGDLGRIALNMAERKLCIDYFDQQLTLLEKKEGSSLIRFSELVYSQKEKVENNIINLSARKAIMTQIDRKMNDLIYFAGQKKETVEEMKARMIQNSTK